MATLQLSAVGLLFLTFTLPCSSLVRDNQYFQDLCFRLTGHSVCWPSEELRNNYTSQGNYNPANIIVTRFQWWRDQVFVCTPSLRPGVPFTLGRFDLFQRGFPCIQPFPSWDSDLHNVVDLYVDARDILWVLDIGIVTTLTNPEVKCHPRVLAFDVLSKKVIHVIDLATLSCQGSRLQHLVVDVCPRTSTPWVFVSDASTRTILVYDVARAKGRRVVLPDVVEPHGPRDVLYLALIRRMDKPSRVYFSYLSSDRMFSMSTEDLRYPERQGSVQDEGRKPHPMVTLGTADTNLFLRYRGRAEVLMWPVDTTLREANLIPIQETQDGRLATQVTIGYGGLLWILESNFQDYIRNATGSLGASVLLHPLTRP
ncbi:uncharacterized protein LOC128998131 [Macrosteles quadrilineatus]|uniref:uncharacterized protein LOC128998131 n=1 Tax=Macrosteles quadrilineatus TaxID=74068 RepID=UPI0023E1F7C1|nr:uncharacterized protein LOC128998131 [Macrosteles quadrilineatus]